ncbi:MAG: ferrochelatase [Planctomycetota bacterium]|nr:ferrochelatase [Planctomycetota bacterium]MCX8039341.1 ferrochelatase [Planctomycetota bacterium]MDW8373632.1 ferrochelatase [Planctomycetota bacterium]
MNGSPEGVLVLGFGGPSPGCCGRRADCARQPGVEARCFVSGILGDRAEQAARIEAVVAHYERLGGYSPYNRLAAAQCAALARELQRRGRAARCALGLRHWSPWIGEACAQLAGCARVAALILAPHAQGPLAEAYARAVTLPVRWAEPWHLHPGFIAAWAERCQEALLGGEPALWEGAALLCTAHALPRAVARAARYEELVAESARALAAALGGRPCRIAYQSAPEAPSTPWTEPLLAPALAELAAAGARAVVLAPLGFLVDHLEVLYDLDIAAQETARALGLRLRRASTPGEHPGLICALADAVEEALDRPG